MTTDDLWLWQWKDEQVDKASDLIDQLKDSLDRLIEQRHLSQQDRMLQSRALTMQADISYRTESFVAVNRMLEQSMELRKDLLGEVRRDISSEEYRRAAAKAHLKLAIFNDQTFSHLQSQHVEIKEQQGRLKASLDHPQRKET